MKKIIITSILVALFAAGSTLRAQNNPQENLGLPGDNLNLYAVMNLFRQSKTLEEFERNLNDEKNNINNLDLNGDNLIDYIKVYDDVDGDVHNIVLQVAVGPKENQDVAVITVQKFDNGQVQIQLTGDEELYGKNYIIEPVYDDSVAGTPNPGYEGNPNTFNGQTITYVTTTPVEIAAWPVVRFIYMPSYTVWHSSWYWGFYPSYWHPWRPFSWDYYYGFHYHLYRDYYRHYRRWNDHRYTRWNNYYYNGRRVHSPEVNHRISEGYYKTTYSHPDQRREGENMFAKKHPDQYKRLTKASTSRTTSTNRRSAAPATTRQENSRNGVKSNTSTRKSTTTVTKKTTVNPSSERNNATTRRSTETVSKKSAPREVKNSQASRSSGKTKVKASGASNRKSETKTKSETKVKNNSDKKETKRRN